MYYFIVGMFAMFTMGLGVGIAIEKKTSERIKLLESEQLGIKIVNKEDF